MRWLLLPGLDGTGQLFDPLLACLPAGDGATVVRYPPDRPLPFDGLVRHVETYLPSDGEHFFLLAESFSGPVALRVAACGPPGLRAVVLCASFARLPLVRWQRVVLWAVSHVLFHLPAPGLAVRALLLGPDAPAPLLAAFYRALAGVRPAVLGQRLRLALAADERPSLSRLAAPLLWVEPTADWLLRYPPAGVGQVSRVDAPHLVLQRAPAEVVGAVMCWLEGCSPSPGPNAAA